MDLLLYVAGTALLIAGFVDIFMTVLYYDEIGYLSTRLYRMTWWIVRGMATRAPSRFRGALLSLGVPVMVAVTLAVWIIILTAGFACFYFVGFREGSLLLREGLEPTFFTALYLSAVSLSTLGFGDITPATTAFKLITSLEALSGFTMLTLAVSYVLNINQIIRQVSTLAVGLRHGNTGMDARSIIAAHLPDGKERGLDLRLQQLHTGSMDLFEGLRHYPIVYYFYGQRAYASTPYIFRMLGDIIATLRFATPPSHIIAKDPWLRLLEADYVTITGYVRRRFLRVDPAPDPTPAPIEQLHQALAGGPAPSDHTLAHFLEVEMWMCNLLEVPDKPDPEQLYSRYQEWLEFRADTDYVVTKISKDLSFIAGG